ncbi:MAG: hypothetical protein FWH55_10095 [Oscillospiraceae bacterium]|nr:hypothetical protein [Oscillospiraceae bacterium]
MSKRILKTSFAVLLLFAMLFQSVATGFAATGGSNGALKDVGEPFAEKIHEMYDAPEEDYWPWIRWWLDEGHHTDSTLKEEVQKIHDMGFSATEFLALPNGGNSYNSLRPYYGWGSAEWTNDSKIVMEKATELDMAVSMTSGTHWATANLPSTYVYADKPFNPDNIAASKEVGTAWIVLEPGESVTNQALPTTSLPTRVTLRELQGVYVYRIYNTTAYANTPATYPAQWVVDPAPKYDLIKEGAVNTATNTVTWTNNESYPVHILALWLYGTGHNSAPSVEYNYTVNYMDPYGIDAVKQYWEEFILTPETKALIMENGKVELYMDSLEITCQAYNNLWGYEMREGFQEKFGYDPLPWLPFVRGGQRQAGNQTRYGGYTDEDKELISKVRNDLFDYTTQMYAENVLKPLQAWLSDYNMHLRAEISYNQTFEISIPAQYVDVVETESLDFETQIDRYRGMAGGAHIFGRLYSCEMGALNNNNYKLGLDHYNQNIYAGLASGITRNVMHGYSSVVGSDSTRWPGNEGMQAGFSGRFGEREPSSKDYKAWTTMISRLQKMNQQGVPKMDLAILRTDYQYDSQHPASANIPYPPQYEVGHYFQDLTMQQLGYTYDYFAPALLENTDYVEFRDGLINPDSMGYQAVILYQEQLSIPSAEKILEFARAGLPVVFVNGLTEHVNQSIMKTHGEAASRSLFSEEKDEDLQAVVAQIKALPNVRTVNVKSGPGAETTPPTQWITSSYYYRNDAHLALQELGVFPRAAYSEQNHNILTAMRDTADITYLFAYNHRSEQTEAYETTLTVDVLGKPYNYNAFTGDIEALPYSIQDGKTVFSLSIEPGDATMVVFDKTAADDLHVVSTTADKAYVEDGVIKIVSTESGVYTAAVSDGSVLTKTISAPANIPLTNWNLKVEKWTASPDGRQVYASETRPAGWASNILGPTMSQAILGTTTSPEYTTEEYWWPTLKTMLDAGTITELKPWQDIPAIGPTVSGVGFYETSFTLPASWADDNGAYLSIGSINGQTASVYVNGVKAQNVNPRDCVVDVSDLLKAGQNTIKIEVTSYLFNSVRELYAPGGMYNSFGGTNGIYNGWSGNLTAASNQPRDFGMTGDVELVTYTVAPSKPNILAYIRSDEATVGLNEPASYTVSLSNAQGAGVVTLSFTADSRYLDLNSATALDGFTILEPLSWEYIGGQMWKGTVKLYCPSFVQDNDTIDVLRISGVALGLLGDTTVTLTGFTASGDVFGVSGDMPCYIMTAEATTTIVTRTVFSKYDLNHDGRIDELDLAIVVFYYLANDLEADWDVVKFDIASAKDCDVALNGRVDLADMIEVIANYCDSY